MASLSAASYCRVSTDRQARDGVSLDVQKETCEKYARSQGWPLVKVYIEDESSYNPRATYQEMLADAVARRFDVLLIYDFWRFGRDLAQSPADISKLERSGIQVISVTSPHASTLERGLQFVLGDEYSRKLAKTVGPAKIRRVQDGHWVSLPPIGYLLGSVPGAKPGQKAPRVLEPAPEMAPKIRALFEIFASGAHSLSSLCREADALGIRTKTGRPLARAYVSHMLRNRAYVGDTVYNRMSVGKFERKGLRPESEWVTVPNTHPPIVDALTFDLCQAILTRHTRHYADITKGKPLLNGVIYCGLCGYRMTGVAFGRWNAAHTARYMQTVYRCNRAAEMRDCLNGTHGGKALERWVQNELRRLPVTIEDQKVARRQLARKTAGQGSQAEKQRRAILDQRDAAQDDLKRLSWRYVREEIPSQTYAAMRTEKEAEIAALNARITGLSHAETPSQAGERALEFLNGVEWDDFDDAAWKEAIAMLVERIEVSGRGEGQRRLTWKPGVDALLMESAT